MEETSEVRGGHGHKTDPAGWDYDVFLSFRGPDTRHGITDQLYESMTNWGIRVFLDDEEIHRGEEIGRGLEQAIRGSRVYVVVFSRDYASSTWCLRELTMMMDCRGHSAGKIVLPIFYDVDPCDVKLRTDLYRSTLDKHKKRYGEEGVKRWEEALVKVGGISGWDYKSDQGVGKFVKLIVQDVLHKLKIRDRSLPDHLIGIDDQVEGVMNMLNCESPEVRVVMVHGMGGIGKTTLANIIFNRIYSRFEGCSYLANVRESSAGEGGIAKLQKKLLGDILGGSVTGEDDSNVGMNLIEARLRGKVVLIILDDVSERRQLDKLIGNCDFFGSRTRIIVTTRDSSVCKCLMRPMAVYTYEMKEMSNDHALQLFSRLAFGGEGPPDDFVALLEQVVRTTGNLPLALEVTAGHLCGESKDVWEYTLQKLKRVPDKDVMRILRISYEGLEEREKQIFLDIACFSNEMPWRYASHMWEACGFYPKYGVSVLQNKSLVKVLNDDEFGMHDLIRDMGREVVCLEGLQHFGLRSRLWNPKDALNVVNQKAGTNKVLAINLGWLSNEHHLASEEFEEMSNLRFLRLCGGQLIGNFRNFRTKLMWLHWKLCKRVPNPAFFNMNNLVILRISGSGITDESMTDLRMGNLRALEIDLSPMTGMPDLSRCSKLVRIILQHCYRLETLHSSIGKLADLRELTLIGCESVEELPESIGRLGALRVLRVRIAKIRKLPASIGSLKSLEVLQFEYCPLDEGIPPEIGGLSSLGELNLDRCDIRQLPGTIHQLSRLRSLFLSRCHKLRELPELPSGLTKLRVVSDSLQRLPDFSSLTNLTELVVIYSWVVQETCGERLTVQSPWFGSKLRELPKRPSSLPELRVTKLTNLTELLLNDFGAALEGMSEGHRQSLQLPWLRKLHRLRRLDLLIPIFWSIKLDSFSMLRELNRSFKTAVQWVHYSNLGFLNRLDLCHSMLRGIRFSGLDMLGNLTSLTIHNYLNLQKLSDLACLRRLSSLQLSYCRSLVDISSVEKMELLEELIISECDSLRKIPDLSDLTRLKSVRILDCGTLLNVPSMIGECYLVVEDCAALDFFEGLYLQYRKKEKRNRIN